MLRKRTILLDGAGVGTTVPSPHLKGRTVRPSATCPTGAKARAQSATKIRPRRGRSRRIHPRGMAAGGGSPHSYDEAAACLSHKCLSWSRDLLLEWLPRPGNPRFDGGPTVLEEGAGSLDPLGPDVASTWLHAPKTDVVRRKHF